MRRVRQLVQFAALASALVLGSSQASAGLIFDASSGGGFNTSRGVGSAPMTVLSVTESVSLTSIAVNVDLNSSGLINFLIFNATSGSLLYQSGGQSFADNGLAFKQSAALDFILSPGTLYSIGANANVGGQWAVDYTPNSMNGITSLVQGNQNVTSYIAPVLDTSNNCCDTGLRLYGSAGDSQPVPAPATLALFGLGLAGLGWSKRKKA